MQIDPADADAPDASDPDGAEGAACCQCGNDDVATLMAVRLGEQARPRRYRMYCGCCGTQWTRHVHE
ncbi:MAG: hypothetical protein ACMZ66_13075 [Thalassospira sp.]|uniref:hypothetical protein n=1 Tax=Thalassospira sp. TaxID=1912094 RepID=UPI003A873AD0